MTAIKDLTGVDVEHLLGATYGPLVKLRAQGPGVVLLGELDPATARKLALDLMDSAARAEYEGDLHRAATGAGMDERTIAVIVHMVRAGEQSRHETDPTEDPTP